MLREHDRIGLTSDLQEEGLMVGDVGIIVHVYRDGEAFDVEFLALDGDTAAVATVNQSQVRPVTRRDITHDRQMRKTA